MCQRTVMLRIFAIPIVRQNKKQRVGGPEGGCSIQNTGDGRTGWYGLPYFFSWAR